ncbi:MAG TPA: hypothetical protein VGH64_06500, partial [Puia sp.]
FLKIIYNKYFNMARQCDSQWVGTVNNLIFYKFRGHYCMRLKPGHVRRTKASVKSSLNFGKASQIGRQIRDVIYPINPCNSDKTMICRFTGALNKMISWKEKIDPFSPYLKKSLPFISGFQFNNQADMPLAIQPAVKFPGSGTMEIQLSPFISGDTLHASFYTDHIVFKMIVTSTSLTEMKTEKKGMTEIRIPYNYEVFQTPVISIPISKNEESLILIVLSIEHFVNKKDRVKMLTDPGKLPCGVIWAGFQPN